MNMQTEVRRALLEGLSSIFDEFNRRWFGGQLKRPVTTLDRIDGAYGTYRMTSDGAGLVRVHAGLLTGDDPQIDKAAPLDGRVRFAADIYRHELVHLALYQSEDSYVGGHGVPFRDICNRIGRDLGLDSVSLESCNMWPYWVRPRGYYLGAFRGLKVSPEDIARYMERERKQNNGTPS